MVGDLYIAGEHISSGSSVVVSQSDGKAYPAGGVSGTLIGNAAEELREGFRMQVRDGYQIYEDDA